ncbi:MAG: carboxypeptidase-like regulatory domain-containing protein [Prolixibacteraceae bacterium]|jgi:iron complex outermembrane receptor protein|nr:carboxypeptidase-like regulatory domain-containing protein [Prolixibacteraceae bacterium]
MKITFTFLFIFLLTFTTFAQYSVKGVVVDKDSKESLIGATVVLKGTTKGTVTNIDGSFLLSKLPIGNQTLLVSYIGYDPKEIEVANDGSQSTVSIPTIELKSNAIGLNEIRVLANIAIDRQTPIAVTNIKPMQIEEKLGTQEFPEILKSSPGVYATKRGGGFGDAEVRIRGFGSNNVAVLINGMPVNGMEDDKVYWSNWAGLSDVTRTMQVQRGIGASKIAVPSVGGTINVITKTTDAKSGGSVFYNTGNGNYQKMGVTLSTGLTEKNWALSMSFSKTTGNGYVDGTGFEGYSYFLNVAKRLNDKHQLSLTVFGAPQEHNKRYGYMSLSDLDKYGVKYNSSWGYLNGQVYSNSTNFYNKPVAILNHYFDINESTYLSSSIYASYGVGGGGYTTENDVTLKYNESGQIEWDQAVADNKEFAAKGAGGGMYFQNSYNNHSWFGALSTLKKTIGSFDYLAGMDLRYYYGEHWQQADDLFGADFIIDKRNRDAVNLYNGVARKGDVIYYDNDGEVMWEGVFVQAEYSQDKLTAFASATLSNRSYRRIDFGQYFSDEVKAQIDSDPDYAKSMEDKLQGYMSSHDYNTIQESEAYTVDQVSVWRNFFAFSGKAGANYNIDSHHNIFVNGGYMERQPIFSTVFQNYKNLINPSAVNEKVTSTEIGYGFRSQYFTANANAYFTLWNDKTTTGNVVDITSDLPDARLFFNIEGVNARHMGLEFDFVAEPIEKLEINGMISLGDWVWNNNVDTVEIFKDQVLVDTYDALYLKGVHVADAAQTSASIGVNYEILPGLKLGTDLMYFDRLFADFNLDTRTKPENEGLDAERIPAFFLMDMNMYYRFKIADLDASLSANMNNVLNTVYIADAVEGKGYYYGYGRTMSMGLKVRF